MTVPPSERTSSAQRTSPQRGQASGLTTIKFRRRSITVKGFKDRPGSELKYYERALQKYLEHSKPRDIPATIEIRQEEQGVLRGNIWEPTFNGSARYLVIPQRYLDVWMMFYQVLAVRKSRSLDQRALRNRLAEQNLRIDEDELQHIVKNHPDISIVGGKISTIKREATVEETMKQAIEDHGRNYVAERATWLLLKTPAQREVFPEEVKPALPVQNIHDHTKIKIATINNALKTAHPNLIAIGDGIRSPLEYWVTEPAVIELIPRPPEDPGKPKERFPWSYICFWLTKSREENRSQWQTPSQIFTTMVDVGFLYGPATINNLCRNKDLRQFIDRRVHRRIPRYRLNTRAFNTWQEDLLRHDITRPFPDSEMNLPIQF